MEGSSMDEQARALLDRLVPELANLQTQAAEAYWKATTTGRKQYEKQYSALQKQVRVKLSDNEQFAQLKKMRAVTLTDPLVKRQIDLLYDQMLPNQIPQADIDELVQRETEIEGIFTRFRATYRGKPLSDNDINRILQTEDDTYKRKEAWYASKQIGEVVKDKLIALVKRRNDVAQKLGFRDYYQMALLTNDIDEDELFSLFDELKQKTDQPYADIKAEMDKIIAQKYKDLRPEGLRPWHYTDPFCQEAPPVFHVDLDKYFKGKKLEDIAMAFFQAIGMDVADILERSDLYERENKYQHAYCTDIDRKGDIRVLCNLRSDERWMDTLLHELGHAVYNKYIDRELPYLLREPAHIASTEAIALMMGRLTKNGAWLAKYTDASREAVDEAIADLSKQLALSQLMFLRWCLVMVYFERDLYANPDRNLNRRWWHYVETIQYIPCPEGRNKPDWAAKIHLSVAPVYYQNYLLGELMASQIWSTIEQNFSEDQNALVASEAVGQFLKERIFRHGRTLHWNELLEKATGEKLNADYHVNRAIGVVKQYFETEKKKPAKRPAKKAE